MSEIDNDLVICPQCCHQFRAIPVNVQKEQAALQAELDAAKEWQRAAFVAHPNLDLDIAAAIEREAK